MGGTDPLIVNLVHNPTAGRYHSGLLARVAEAFAARGAQVIQSATGPGGYGKLAHDADLVCVFGGDGALGLVASAMAERLAAVPLCVYPAGTINLVARELGYARDPEKFAAQVLAAFARGAASWVRSPLFSCTGVPVMACLSSGPDSAAVARCSPALKARIGRFAYVIATVQLLWQWPRTAHAVSAQATDGRAICRTAEAVFVARGHYYAGPWSLASAARIDTADFHLIVMPRAGRVRTLLFALSVMSGIDPARIGLAEFHTVEKVTITGTSLPIQIDGDAIVVPAAEIKLTGETVLYCI